MSSFAKKYFEEADAVDLEIATALAVGDLQDIATTIREVAEMLPLPWEEALHETIE